MRLLSFLLSVLALAAPLTACRKSSPVSAEVGPSKQSIEQSFEAVKAQASGLTTKLADLHKRYDPLPKGLDGLSEAQGKLFTAEEILGTTNARLTWLASQVDAAEQSGTPEALQPLAKQIARAASDLQQVDAVGLELTHRLVGFERNAVLMPKQADAGH